MVRWPWQNAEADDSPEADADAVAECSFQDGSLYIREDRVGIVRPNRSRHSDKTIEIDRISGVHYDKGITIGYLQIEEQGVEPDSGGLFSDPVDENTLHFGRGGRECAENARDEICRVNPKLS